MECEKYLIKLYLYRLVCGEAEPCRLGCIDSVRHVGTLRSGHDRGTNNGKHSTQHHSVQSHVAQARFCLSNLLKICDRTVNSSNYAVDSYPNHHLGQPLSCVQGDNGGQSLIKIIT